MRADFRGWIGKGAGKDESTQDEGCFVEVPDYGDAIRDDIDRNEEVTETYHDGQICKEISVRPK